MQVNFLSSQTRINLMRAFAGESQARNRYTFAQQTALQKNLYVISEIFKFTADEEKAHAEIFFDLLKESAGNTVEINGGYPADVYDDIQKLLSSSVHNESEEHEIIYPSFAKTAVEEGFTKAASKFNLIAEIEKKHGERFSYYENLMKSNRLFKSDKSEKWLCLNCGHIHEGSEAPLSCPVCGKNQGYFIRADEAPFTASNIISLGE